MLKQMIAIVAVSTAIIFAMPHVHQGVLFLINSHDWISQILTEVFSGGQAGNFARGMIALLSVPLLVGIVSALIYWAVRRHWFPYFMEIVWIVWLVQVGALMILFKAV